MQFAIYRDQNDNIVTTSDFRNPRDKSEVANMLVELELVRQDLMELWCYLKDQELSTS